MVVGRAGSSDVPHGGLLPPPPLELTLREGGREGGREEREEGGREGGREREGGEGREGKGGREGGEGKRKREGGREGCKDGGRGGEGVVDQLHAYVPHAQNTDAYMCLYMYTCTCT